MSKWVHITACLSVDTFLGKEASELKQTVEKLLEKAPKITGSEGPADVFVNIQSGWNLSTWDYDCAHCKYKDTKHKVTENGKEWEECDGPDEHDCFGHFQTCIVISIQGDLRDKTKKATENEFNRFLKYISKRCKWWLRDYSVNIIED